MAGVAEKARFYIERSVPQLREWEDKEIFTKDEIRTIVQKRSDHEHRILAPVSKPADFAAYATWEQSLDSLRLKRCKRLKISHVESAHASQARILKIFVRGVERHPGSRELWRAYLAYAGKVKASKRWRKVVVQALRMHPTDAGLWVMAGRRAASNGDMNGARAFFMRGCRFCKDVDIWIEYARCEMEWLAKMERRRNGKKEALVLQSEQAEDGDNIRFDHYDDGEDEDEALILPEPSAKQETSKVFTEEASKQLSQKNPAMDGAIPLAIFDISTKQPFSSPSAAASFFDLFASFITVSHHVSMAQHVLDSMIELYPSHPATYTCYVRRPIVGIDHRTAEFPKALREILKRLNEAIEQTTDRKELAGNIVAWIDTVLGIEGVDEGIQTVLEHTKRKLQANLS